MKEQIIEMLKKIEEDLVTYNKAAQDSQLPDTHKGPISFKFLTEMIRYNTLCELVPDFESAILQEVQIAKGLAENAKLVSVQNGKVVVSTQFEELIKMQNQYKNGKIS